MTMEQHFERVSKRLGGAGLGRDGAQSDEVDTNEPHRGGSGWSTETEPESENEQGGLQTHSKGHAEESPASSSHRGHNTVRSHYNKPYVNEAAQRRPPRPIETLKKHRMNRAPPRPPRPEAGDVLVGDHSFTARSFDEFGDGWFWGKKSLPGKYGLAPKTYTSFIEPKPELVTRHGLGGHRDLDKVYPEKRKTRIPAHLISKRAALNLGYTFNQEGENIVLSEAIGSEDMDDLLKLSELYHKINLDEPVPRTMTPLPSPVGYSDRSYGNDHNKDDEVVMPKEHTLLASLYAQSEGGDGFSVEDTDSNASYSAMFSEESRQQPTDPSSWRKSSSAAAMRGDPVDATFSGTKEEFGVEREAEVCSRSISSVEDSIGSAISGGGALAQAGVNYVVEKFTQSDPELLALYTEASQRLTKDRFIDNTRRLLKIFYLDFVREEQIPSHREAVAFLRSRRRRAEISLGIFRTVTPDYDAYVSVEGHRKEFSILDSYFETLRLGAADADKGFEDEQDALKSDESEIEDVDEQTSVDMNSLQAIGESFITSRALSQHKQRLHHFLHPGHGKGHESTDLQGADHERREHPMDASSVVVPGAMAWTKTGTEHSVADQSEGTRNQAEESLTEHKADEVRNISRSDNFKKLLASSSQIRGRRMPWERESFGTWVGKWVTDTLWPPSKDSQRVWYFCGCGQQTYIDVKELEPGGVENEWRSISESSAAATRAHSPQSSVTSGDQLPATPSPVHMGANSSRIMASPNSTSQQIPHAPRPYLNPASAISPGPSGATQRDPMFLLICINGKAYKTVAELRCLDINDSYNDELLIRGILNQYEQSCKGCQWTIDLLLPKWILPAGLLKHLKSMWDRVSVSVRRPHFIRESLMAQSISEWWSKWAPDISPWAPLHIVDTADFVEFELVPHPEGKEAFPSHFTSGRWPAPDNKQYRYRPVPMRCVKTMNLWHMRRPGPHTEVYWYNTVPKKVDGALYRPSGTVEAVVGYGVRINERLNDVLILWWSFIFILVTGVFIYVYSRCTNDNSSAFGMGAYLVAALTMYIQLQYAWWKRT